MLAITDSDSGLSVDFSTWEVLFGDKIPQTLHLPYRGVLADLVLTPCWPLLPKYQRLPEEGSLSSHRNLVL